MAWAKATIEIKPAAVGTGIKVSLKKLRASAAKLSITVTGATMKVLGWKDGDKLEVLIGEAEHHGMIRLRKNNSVGVAVVTQKKALHDKVYQTIHLGHQPAFVDRGEAAAWCQWEEVDEGWIEVILPKWADETSPRKPAAAPPRQVPSTAKAESTPFLRKQSVTANLMGDPPPGRREMLAKVGKLAAE